MNRGRPSRSACIVMPIESDLQASETAFHDAWAASVDVATLQVDTAFEGSGCPENAQILEWMGDLQGKQVLEVGCGCGEASVYFAMKGAHVTAVDISPGMLAVVQSLASRYGVSVTTACASADQLSNIPNGAFDYVYAANLLHHTDVRAVLEQVRLKLKSDGCAFFWDPLSYNPIVNMYRYLATEVRTADEHPLRRCDIKSIREVFADVETRFVWFTALVVFLKYFLVDRIHPNQARYWKKVIVDGPRLRWLAYLHRIDRAVFARLPAVRWFGWNVVVRARATSFCEAD